MNKFTVVAALSALAITGQAQVIGTFDAARGGIASLTGASTSTLQNAITSNIAGTSFVDSNIIDAAFLATIDILMISSADGGTSAITPLSSDEQTALGTWVNNGGKALLFVDNNTFAADAELANESLLDPFGLDVTGTANGAQTITTINRPNPIADGPYGAVDSAAFQFTGWFDNLGAATAVAQLNANNQAALATLETGSGAVVFFSDSSILVNGFGSANTNTLILNSIDYVESVPEPATLTLLAAGTALLARRKRKA